MEKNLSRENLRKILKVNHFHLGFLWNETHKNIKHSVDVSLEISDSYRSSLKFSKSGSRESNKTLGECSIS